MNFRYSIAYFLWVAPFVSFLIGYWLLSACYPVQELETPNLVGLNVHQAVSIASNQHINIRILAEKEDDTLQDGTIMSQTPEAQQKIKAHQSLFLVVSKKPAPVLMPSLFNMSQQEIIDFCKQHSLHIRCYYVPSTKPKNIGVAHYPAAGQPISISTPVVYLSAEASDTVIMPNFKGGLVKEILEFLSKYPVSTELVHQQHTSAQHICSACMVIDQRPLPGSILHMNQHTSLHVQLLVG